MTETKKEQDIVLIVAILVIAIITLFVVGNGTNCFVNSEGKKSGQTQTLENGAVKQNQNEPLLIGCNGFF